MKKLSLFLTIIFIVMVFFGCKADKQNNEQPVSKKQSGEIITVINEIREANIWILPDTQANRKTTLWGAATLPKLELNGTGKVDYAKLGRGEAYLIRIIDSEGIYYSADGVKIGSGYTLRLMNGDEPLSAVLEVTDSEGKAAGEYSLFAGKL